MNANKVKYGLSNAHYAKQTTVGGKVSFGTPKPWPGSVSLALDPQGDTNKFPADNIDYYVSVANNGYDGDFESALVPEDFRTDILGETKDGNGILVERADAQSEPFALLFEFEGDVKKTRHVLYNCVASRPPVESNTKTSSVEPVTEKLKLTATAICNDTLDADIVKASTCSTTTKEAYDGWYDEVYMPTAATASEP